MVHKVRYEAEMGGGSPPPAMLQAIACIWCYRACSSARQSTELRYPNVSWPTACTVHDPPLTSKLGADEPSNSTASRRELLCAPAIPTYQSPFW